MDLRTNNYKESPARQPCCAHRGVCFSFAVKGRFFVGHRGGSSQRQRSHVVVTLIGV